MRGSLKLTLFALVVALLSTLLLDHLKRVDLPDRLPRLKADLLFVEPDDGRAPILERIRGAEKSILIKCYLFSDSPIIKEVIGAKARGLDVRVMLERNPYGESQVNHRTKRRLEEAGVMVKWAPKRFALTHEKSIIIDHNELIIMTLNLCSSAFKENREYGIVVSCEKVVGEAVRIFEADWRVIPYIPKGINLIVSPDNTRRKLLHLIKRASKRIWIQMLLLEDTEIMEALKDAGKRGVDVRILLADPLKVEVNRMAREYLEGLEVRFLHSPFLHAKFIDFDGEICFIGSQNLSTQSLDENREMGLLITSRDVMEKLEEVFKRDWSHGIVGD